ncbi:MAG: DUF1592 domain-containing protein [Planctomycetales bacterium]|nr:DUF1592 domain-containing protein [Planctomycetales bacterium]
MTLCWKQPHGYFGMKWTWLLLWMILASSLPAAEGAVDRQRFFADHCIRCHGGDNPEGELRFDLPLEIVRENLDLWSAVASVLERSAMPPADEPQPSLADKAEFLSDLNTQLNRIDPPPGPRRRLSRREYEYTVQDLLGIETSLSELLPEDGTVQGFDNVSGGLDISSILLERYLEAADVAFESTIRRIKPLPSAIRHIDLMDQKENVDSVKGNKGGVIESAGAFVDFTPGWPPARVDGAHPIEAGLYRCRVAVWPVDPGPQRTLTVAVFTGPLFGDGKRVLQGFFDVTGSPDQPRIIEFTTHMDELHALHILPWIYPEHVTWRDKEESRPGVAISWAETEGPLDQEFPSESQQRLFGSSESLSMQEGESVYIRHRRGVRSHFVDSTTPAEDLERIMRDFVTRAMRRPTPEPLVEQFTNLAQARLAQGSTFEQAVRAGVTAVLCSPHFLLLNQSSPLDDYDLACRLSYFLWSSMPDSDLMDVAAQGKLREPQVLHEQVERLLADARSIRFVNAFTDQWLDLQEIEFTSPDKKLYPEFDDLLLRSMVQETHGFFQHMLDHDLDVMNFVHSDFAYLNQRMAEHYGIPGISGHEQFRIVQLPQGSVRGGILTHASVLKVTANGTSTSPVIRGNWVLEKLLARPTPPPPSGVPAVEPDIRGTTTIREQLDAHRQDASCNRCHQHIDPPGFALEEFDVIGGHRTRYRSLQGRGPKIPKTNYFAGPEVDSSGCLWNGRPFADFVEFRNQLLEEPEAVVRSLAEKLLVYACGQPIPRNRRDEIEQVVQEVAGSGRGLRSLIHAVVQSKLFLGTDGR